MRTPSLIAQTAADLNLTACPQPNYMKDVRVRLYSVRDQKGRARLARFTSGPWRDKHVFELEQLVQVSQHLAMEPVVIRVFKHPEVLTPTEALESVRSECLAQIASAQRELASLEWRLQEIDVLPSLATTQSPTYDRKELQCAVAPPRSA